MHHIFGDGEAIDWPHSIFVLDAQTERTENAYAEAGLESSEHCYRKHRDGWIETSNGEDADDRTGRRKKRPPTSTGNDASKERFG